jgi:hypothetical protein
MKYSPTGWAAEYRTDEGEETFLRVIEQWGAEGEPLVVDLDAGQLASAATLPGFLKLVPLTRAVSVVSAAPGWSVRADAFGDREGFIAPIAGWVMDGEGTFWPVIPAGEDESGFISKPDPRGEMWLRPVSSSSIRIIPPKVG